MSVVSLKALLDLPLLALTKWALVQLARPCWLLVILFDCVYAFVE